MTVDAPQPEEQLPAELNLPAAPHEPAWMLVAGIVLMLGFLTLTWYDHLVQFTKHPTLDSSPVGYQTLLSARAGTLAVEALIYLSYRPDLHLTAVQRNALHHAVVTNARNVGELWEQIDVPSATSAVRVSALVNAAALYHVANQDIRAFSTLSTALKRDRRQSMTLMPLFALLQPPPPGIEYPANFTTPATLRFLAAAPTGVLYQAFPAIAAGDAVAITRILEPVARAGLRVLAILGAALLLMLLAFGATLLFLLLRFQALETTLSEVNRTTMPPTPWGVGMALVMVSALQITTLALMLLFFTAVPHLRPRSFGPSTIIIETLAEMVSAALLIAVFTALYGRTVWDLSILGWRRVRQGVGYGLLALVLTLPFVWVASWITSQMMKEHDAANPLIPFLANTHDPRMLCYFIFVAVIMAPVIEETFYRGMLFQALGTRVPFWAAAAISGALFACAHGELAALLPIFVLGLLLAFLVRRTGGLAASVAAHAAFNGLTTIGVLLLSWALQAPGM